MNDSSYRVCNTADLTALNFRAHRLNHCLSTEAINSLDPEGLHVLNVVVGFHNDDHHRTKVLFKKIGTDEPGEALLDMAVDDWLRLKTVEQVKGMSAKASS